MKNLNGKLGWGVGEDSSNYTATSTNSVTNRKLIFSVSLQCPLQTCLHT